VEIKRRTWKWLGHMIMNRTDVIERDVFDWKPQANRRRGRSRRTWEGAT
jgi:hypothetical protein